MIVVGLRWRDRSHVSTVGPVILLELYPLGVLVLMVTIVPVYL